MKEKKKIKGNKNERKRKMYHRKEATEKIKMSKDKSREISDDTIKYRLTIASNTIEKNWSVFLSKNN